MCGIGGILRFDCAPGPVEMPLVETMMRVMAHRGPDGDGFWRADDGRMAFGHLRLAIVDLSTAAGQPMVSPDGRYVLCFNGEIYNHADIRRELIALGISDWKTDHSDTEVLLLAFRQWGIACLQRLRGFFAFGLWDRQERKLWLVRDRVGVKPLYYCVRDGQIAFASEIKGLLTDPRQPRQIDEVAIHDYLTFTCVPAPRTMFQGIFKLPASTWMCVHGNGKIEEGRYWDPLHDAVSLAGQSEAQIAAGALAHISVSLDLRMVSDVPIGVFLSGGVDSSAVTMMLSRKGHKVETFSIGYDGDNPNYPDELGWARLVAEQAGAKHHELKLTENDAIDFLPQLIHLQDEPIGDPTCVPNYYVSRLARQNGVKVALVGEGADEIFCGYPFWLRTLSAQRMLNLPVGNCVRKAALWANRMLNNDERFHGEFLARAIAGQPVHWTTAQLFTRDWKNRLLSPRSRERFAGRTAWEAIEPIHARFKQAGGRGILDWMAYVELNLRLPELLLMRVDKMSMGASIECREPFLDHKLIEYTMGIPEDMKIADGELKHILKLGLRGIVDDRVLDRKKQGFGLPVQDWISRGLGAVMDESLSDFCRDTGILDYTAAQGVISSRQPTFSWPLLNLALWWKYAFQAPKAPAM
jgi:asparagine synthase (glutamine-hydrolysing)